MAVRQIQVTVGSVTNRKTEVVSSSTTLRETFEAASIEYAGGIIQLDGIHTNAGDLDRSFDELGIIGDKAMLISTIKGDNA